MRWQDGSRTEVTPPDANVRTRVHEYGGGAWTVNQGIVYYVDDSDQRLRKLQPDGSIQFLSAEPTTPRALRYADFQITPDGEWIIAVGERHTEGYAVENFIVAIRTDGSFTSKVITEGSDFYQSPRVSPDGSKLAWIEWQHPNLPWDDTTLFQAELAVSKAGISLGEKEPVAGGNDEAIVQPLWSPTGELHFLSGYLASLDTRLLRAAMSLQQGITRVFSIWKATLNTPRLAMCAPQANT